jgi:hypothetical protein
VRAAATNTSVAASRPAKLGVPSSIIICGGWSRSISLLCRPGVSRLLAYFCC